MKPTLQDIKNKILNIHDFHRNSRYVEVIRTRLKHIIYSYNQANGDPCERPGHLQESDYESVMEKLNNLK